MNASIFPDFLKRTLCIATAGILAGFLAMSLNANQAQAQGNNSGWDTVCQVSASRTEGMKKDSNDSVSLVSKIKTGKSPLLVEFTSSVDNALSFSGAAAKWEFLQVPDGDSAQYEFSRIIVETDALDDCALGGVNVEFKNPATGTVNALLSIDDPRLKPANLDQESFNGLMDVMGFGGVAYPSGTEQQIAEDICAEIRSQLLDGNGLALSTAGDIGALSGAGSAAMARCVAASSIVSIGDANGMANGCTGDDIAGKLASDFLQFAPEFNLKAVGDGNGTYQVFDLANGDTVQITLNSDGTCTASGNVGN